MLNCDKSILVCYLNVYCCDEATGVRMVNEVKKILDDCFFTNTKENNDDSLVILVIPTDYTEIKLLNARYPDYKTIEDYAKTKLEEFLEDQKNIPTK